MQDEFDALDRAKTAAAALDAYDPANLARATLAALRAERDPLEDEDVRRALAAHTVRDSHLANLVNAEAEATRVAVFVERLPEMIEGWAKLVEEADATLADARERYPNLDPTDAQAVKSMRPDDMGKWGRAHEAVGVVQEIESMLVSVHGMRGGMNHRLRPLLVADLSADDLDALHREVMNPGAVDVIRGGHRLALATPDEYRARCARVNGERAQAAERLAAVADHSAGAAFRFTA